MEYSEDDIQSSKDILEFYLLKYGVERTLNLLKDIGNDLFWREYEEFREHEQDENDSFFTLDNLEEDEKEKLDVPIDKVKKIWKIFSQYPEVQKIITDSMNEMDYDPKEIATRATTIHILISTIELLDEVPKNNFKYFDVLYKAVNQKLSDLNTTDFYLVYSNVLAENFFNNTNFERVITDKINNMSISEFIYFMITAQEYLDINNKHLIDLIKTKVETFDDPFVNKVYESLQYIDMPQAKISSNKLDKVEKLIRGIEDKEEAIKTFVNLTDTELIRYFLHYENTLELLDPNIYNSKEFNERIKQLSRENLIFLVEKFIDIYDYAKHIEITEKDDTTKEYGMQWKCIFDEAIARGVIADNFEVKYSDEDMFEVIKMESVYDINKNIGILPCFYPEMYEEDSEIAEGEEEYSEEDYYESEYDEDEEEAEKNELKDLEVLYKNLDDLLNFYISIDELYQITGSDKIKVLQMANHYNTKYKADDIESLSMSQQYLIRYLKSSILCMPLKYAAFFMMVENGCLNDAMEIKTEEMQSKILNKIDKNDLDK